MSHRYGLAFTNVLAIVVLLLCGYKLIYTMLWPMNWKPPVQVASNILRASTESRLKQMPGQHVVIVHYQQMHSVFDEWVYNLADIDAQKVIWARDMGPQRDDQLAHYYQGRHLWVVDPDEPGAVLHKYEDVRMHLGGKGAVAPIDPARIAGK
jgi:hypothetical protein